METHLVNVWTRVQGGGGTQKQMFQNFAAKIFVISYDSVPVSTLSGVQETVFLAFKDPS